MIGRRDALSALLEQAERYAKTGQYGRAAALAARAIRRRPDDPRGYRAAGEVELRRRNVRSACARLEQALRLTPDDPGLHGLLVEALRGRRAQQQPERPLPPLVEGGGLDADAWCQLALIAYGQGDVATTRRWADRALALDRRHVTAVSARAILEIASRTPGRDSVPMYLHALAADPDNPQVHHDLGALYLNMGDHARAEHHLRAALAGRPDEPVFRDNLYAVLRHRSTLYRVLTWPLQSGAAWPRHVSMVVALGGVAALATIVARRVPGTPLADALGGLQALILILATCFACVWWPLVMIYEWLTLSGIKAAARRAGAGRPQPAARGLSARFALYVVFMVCIAAVIVLAALDPLSQRFVTVLVFTFDVSIAISLWLTAAWTARNARTPARGVGPFVQR